MADSATRITSPVTHTTSPVPLPHDVKQICLWYVRGYDRRKHDYHDQLESITYGSGGDLSDMPHGTTPGDPTASKADKLSKLNQSEAFRIMQAVEQAKNCIGTDLPEQLRQKLTKAMWTSCTHGRECPFERLGIDCMGRSEFYRRRDIFLGDIALLMGLINENEGGIK